MAAKLFVGGLSPATTPERLREAFAACGTVESATIATGDDGQSRSFGFVEMATPEEAEEAMRTLDRSSLDGRMIKVEWARHPPTARRPAGRRDAAQAPAPPAA